MQLMFQKVSARYPQFIHYLKKGRPHYKHPCGVCNKSVNANQQAVQCTTRSKWVHRKCNGTSVNKYKILMEEDENVPWQCIFVSLMNWHSSSHLDTSLRWN